MARIHSLFPTLICQGNLRDKTSLNRALLRDISELSRLDRVGRAWSRRYYRKGYTSYASLCDLHHRTPAFGRLVSLLQPEAERYARALGWDLSGCSLELDTCWMNIMPANTYHTLHLHPHSVLSGTYYVDVPKGSACLKLEDPRMPMYMNAPVRDLYYEVHPQAGSFVLFESWLRHEVPPNESRKPRISVSFNYSLQETE